jgi:hypothetical protein
VYESAEPIAAGDLADGREGWVRGTGARSRSARRGHGAAAGGVSLVTLSQALEEATIAAQALRDLDATLPAK